MQQPSRSIVIDSKTAKSLKAGISPVVFAASVLLTLFGIFTIAGWAETAALGHATQHAVIFLGGIGAGTSLLTSIKNRKDK